MDVGLGYVTLYLRRISPLQVANDIDLDNSYSILVT